MAFKKNKSAAPAVIEQSVHLPTVETRRMAVRLNGETPLIVHRFEEKAITEMLAKQRGLPFERQKKNPHKDYEASKYKNIKDEDCIPVMTVKKAMVEAATFSDDMTKKQTRGGFMIIGEYAPLEYGEVRLRQDMVRLSGIGRTPDIRFRAEYLDWSVDLVIEFNPRLITPDQILYLLRSAGTAVGICEWRIQKDGNYGAFSVETLPEKNVEAIVEACKVPRKPYNLPEWVMREINNEDDLKAAVDAAKKASGSGTSTGGRGRKAAAVEVVDETEAEETPAPKRRGRPPGSKNGTNGAHSDEAH
jgi:hypothetical protein